MSLTAELLKEFESQIASLEVIPSHGGVFEVSINGESVFSKKSLGRHAENGEIRKLVEARLKTAR